MHRWMSAQNARVVPGGVGDEHSRRNEVNGFRLRRLVSDWPCASGIDRAETAAYSSMAGFRVVFQILTEREKGPAWPGQAQRLPFRESGSVIVDPRLVAPSSPASPSTHIIESGSESYRPRCTRTRARKEDGPSPLLSARAGGGR
jgi:hypothetical protein